MKFAFLGALAVSSLAVGIAASQSAGSATPPENASPIYGVTIPEGYRDWKFIAPAQEAPPLDELRAVLGNDIAVDAYKKAPCLFPTARSSSNWPTNANNQRSSRRQRCLERRPRCRSW